MKGLLISIIQIVSYSVYKKLLSRHPTSLFLTYFSGAQDRLLKSIGACFEHKLPPRLRQRSIQRRLVRTPKFYFFDSGVLRAITCEIGIPMTPGSFRYGDLFKNLVVQEIVRYALLMCFLRQKKIRKRWYYLFTID